MKNIFIMNKHIYEEHTSIYNEKHNLLRIQINKKRTVIKLNCTNINNYLFNSEN